MIWNNIKYWLIAAGVLFLYLFGYRQGKEKAETRLMKGTIDVVKNAKQSRDSLSDPARVKRLHDKYKR